MVSFLLPIDELNTLEAGIVLTMTDPNLSKESKKELIKSDIEDFLLLCYLMGAERTEYNFQKKKPDIVYKRDDDKLYDALYKEFKGKTVVQEIDEYVEKGDIPSINRVADTGMTRLYSTGAYDAGEQFGGGVKVWQTMQDDRVRETHEFLQSVKVRSNERFYTFDGDSARFPGDFTNPANNVNCRCMIDYLPE